MLAAGLQLLHEAAPVEADPLLLDLPAGQVKDENVSDLRSVALRCAYGSACTPQMLARARQEVARIGQPRPPSQPSGKLDPAL